MKLEKYSLRMYNLILEVYGWLLKDAEIFHKPEFIIKLFDNVDELLYDIREDI